MTSILGISALYHDSAAALVIDGEIVAAAQEERFTRRKHDWRFPGSAIQYCLQEAGISPAGVDYVGFYDKPLLKFDRLLETYLSFAPRGYRAFAHTIPSWLHEKLHVASAMNKALGGQYRRRFLYAEHHQSHAASAFFPSPFDEAAILTLDGVGEWATAACGVGRGNHVELVKEMRFPHSLGLLYSAFTYFCGFRVNSGEYKLMGLAPYGEPRYVDEILGKLIDLKDDGSFRMEMSYFNYCHGLTMTSAKFAHLFGGPPRHWTDPITQREMDLAASIQHVTEEIMLRMARWLHHETGANKLCLAGGVALNCVANGRILREGPYHDLWIQPAAGDAGGALGVALFIWHQLLGGERSARPCDRQHGSLLGPRYSDAQIKAVLDQLGAQYEHVADEDQLICRTTNLLAEGKIVGWMQGRMEFGPRALGARSILGDARDERMQSLINQKIKFRESFRPFAPAVMQEHAAEHFDFPPSAESPYMLLVAPVAQNQRLGASGAEPIGLDKLRVVRSVIPAVTHVDYSARLQTVGEPRCGRFYRLLRRFADKTGTHLLVNTSFNVKDEPIVCSPEDAYHCFMATGLDALVIEGFMLLKEQQPPAESTNFSQIEFNGRDIAGEPVGPVVEVSREPTRMDCQIFAGGLAAVLLLLGWLAYARGTSTAVLAGLAVGAAILGTAAAVGPGLLRRPYIGWMWLTYPLRWLVSYLMLGLMFYLVITPIGCLKRFLGGDPLNRRRNQQAASYWIDRTDPTDLERYFRQF